MRNLVTAALALTLAAGCGDRNEAPPSNTGVATTYAPELEVDLNAMTRSETGLYVQDVTVGPGPEARAGSVVTVHYTGWLPAGAEFDSSRGSDPIQFPLGEGAVVAGWEEGLLGMRAGGRRKLVIPAHLGYGSAGSGPIPPYATLVFDVEMVAVDGVTGAAADTTSRDSVPSDTARADTTSHDH